MIEDHHRRPPLPLAGLRRFLRAAQAAVPLRGEVGVRLLGDEAMRELNAYFRGRDAATDVLSFPSGAGAGGDLAISVETAARQARRRRHSLDTELRILILHGLLHLAGHDHETDGGLMRARERELRRGMGLPAGLIERAQARRKRAGRTE